MNGEESGNTLKIKDILVDCDQDALVLLVEPAGPACHTGASSCFYRRLENGRWVASAASGLSAVGVVARPPSDVQRSSRGI